MHFKHTLFALAAAAGLATSPVMAADHIDAPFTSGTPNADINDLYAFTPSEDTVAFVMTIHPFADSSTRLNPDYLYQFKIDTTGDAVEDQVIQVIAVGTGDEQSYIINGPTAPEVSGASGNTVNLSEGIIAQLNETVSSDNFTAFVGLRDDPFFFDLAQFNEIIADVAEDGVANQGFNDPGSDTLAGANTLAIVVEMDRSVFTNDQIRVWATSSLADQ